MFQTLTFHYDYFLPWKIACCKAVTRDAKLQSTFAEHKSTTVQQSPNSRPTDKKGLYT
jgi:hypothetical protein